MDMLTEEKPRSDMNVDINRALKALTREYVVVGKHRIHAGIAWMVIGVIAGLVAGVVAVMNLPGSLGNGYQFVTAEAASSPQLKWSVDFESRYSSGKHSKGCGTQKTYSNRPDLAYRGSGVHMSEATGSNCSGAIRQYPTFDGNVPLPALIMFWVKTDVPGYPGISKAEAYKQIGGDRFSPLTAKERTDAGKSYQCVSSICNGGSRSGKSCTKNSECPNNALIFTTHILGDGTMDIGHSKMSFRSRSVKIPLDTWHLEAMYIENKGSGSSKVTEATIYINNKVAAIGTAFEIENKPWNSALKHWHMGWYGDREGNSGPFKIYNDEMKAYAVPNKASAESLIAQEVGGKAPVPPPPSPTPSPPPPPSPTPSPAPSPTPPPPPSGGSAFTIGARVVSKETLNVRGTPGGDPLYGTHSAGVLGTVVDGPEIGVGGNDWWWKIDYEQSPDGWSREDQLEIVEDNDPPPPSPAPAPSGETAMLRLTPSNDAYLRNNRLYNDSTLRVHQTSVTRTMYIMFDIPGSALRGKSVASATLKLQNKDSQNRTGEWNLSLGSHSNWTEENLRRSSAPSLSRLIGILKGTIPMRSVVEMDVSSVVAGPGTYTFIMHPKSGAGLRFRSSESSTPPELILTLR